MYKYAEIYGGLVKNLKESALGYTEFCSIYDPSSYWVDVTHVEDIEIGYIVRFQESVGTYFEKPSVEQEVTLESKKAEKLELLDREFKRALEHAYILSSLGFYANAGTRAKGDVDGLITKMETKGLEQTIFMDLHNMTQTISLEEAKILRIEIIENGEFVYGQKWSMRDTINNAKTISELEDMNIYLKMFDFLNNNVLENS